jgi:hypothetical protein
MFTCAMNLIDLTVNQLKRAAAIKEQVEKLNKELASIVGTQAKSGTASRTHRTMGAAVKKKIAAAQKARWAKIRGARTATTSIKPAGSAKKKSMSPAARAKLSAKLKAFWAAKRSAKK